MELVFALWVGLNVGFGISFIRSCFIKILSIIRGKRVVQSTFGIIIDRVTLSSIVAQVYYVIYFSNLV